MLALDTDHIVEYQKGIAMANHATLLTRNTDDYRRDPDLRIEDWLS